MAYSIEHRDAMLREMNDNHLTTDERRTFLEERGIEFNEKNLDEVYSEILWG